MLPPCYVHYSDKNDNLLGELRAKSLSIPQDDREVFSEYNIRGLTSHMSFTITTFKLQCKKLSNCRERSCEG